MGRRLFRWRLIEPIRTTKFCFPMAAETHTRIMQTMPDTRCATDTRIGGNPEHRPGQYTRPWFVKLRHSTSLWTYSHLICEQGTVAFEERGGQTATTPHGFSTIRSDDSVSRVNTCPLPEQDAQRKADPPTMLSNDSRPPLRCPPADSDSGAPRVTRLDAAIPRTRSGGGKCGGHFFCFRIGS